MATRFRTFVATTVAVAALVGATACDPWVPAVHLEVNTEVVAPDADPGDGICEMTPGAGNCSLRAAIEEGNALGSAAIDLPAGYHTTLGSISVTGVLAITEVGPGPAIVDAWITVAPGAQLTLDGVGAYGVPGTRVLVEGTFIGRRISLTGLEGNSQVVVAPTGTAVLDNSILVNVFGAVPTVRNEGTVVLRNSSLRAWSSIGVTTPALTNTGTVTAQGTILQSCAGTPPISQGGNNDDDGSCGLTGPGDLPGVPAAVSIQVGDEVVYDLLAGSPLVDAIPEGTLSCGDDGDVDHAGVLRPQDGDGDGIAACDIGARERPAAR